MTEDNGDLPMRTQGKLIRARPTQNMKRMMRRVRAQHSKVLFISTPTSLMATRLARVVMIRVTTPVDTIISFLRPNL